MKYLFDVFCEEEATNKYTIAVEANTKEEAVEKLKKIGNNYKIFLEFDVINEEIVDTKSTKEIEINYEPTVLTKNRLAEELTRDILDRYDNITYWHPEVVREFYDKHKDDLTEAEKSFLEHYDFEY